MMKKDSSFAGMMIESYTLISWVLPSEVLKEVVGMVLEGGLDLLGGALHIEEACTDDRVTTSGAPSPDTLKFGTHFSNASPINFSDGLM
jgi:hypothetical protein